MPPGCGFYRQSCKDKVIFAIDKKKEICQWENEHAVAVSDRNRVFWMEKSKFEAFGSKRTCETNECQHGGGHVIVCGQFGTSKE